MKPDSSSACESGSAAFERPYVISWNLTYRCNLACEHCYLDAGGKPQVATENCELPDANSGLWLGAALGELAWRGRDKLTFVIDPPLSSFALWAEQLVAESTGKRQRGILPVADEPLVATELYGADRVFGGSGNDTVRAVGGGKDFVDCGGGTKDVVYADSKDDLHNCEIRK